MLMTAELVSKVRVGVHHAVGGKVRRRQRIKAAHARMVSVELIGEVPVGGVCHDQLVLIVTLHQQHLLIWRKIRLQGLLVRGGRH